MLIDELRRENLCTHYVLPLLKLNKFSFSSFVNCFLLKDKAGLAVSIVELLLLDRRVQRHLNYVGVWQGDRYAPYYYVVYSLPLKWSADIDLFLKGKYSAMTNSAKDHIIRYGGLPYRKRDMHGNIVTDHRLLALERNERLKEWWEHALVVELSSSAELMSIPNERTFIDLRGMRQIKEGQP